MHPAVFEIVLCLQQGADARPEIFSLKFVTNEAIRNRPSCRVLGEVFALMAILKRGVSAERSR